MYHDPTNTPCFNLKNVHENYMTNIEWNALHTTFS